MTKELSAPLSFIAKILILSREIQIPALQQSLQELGEVSAIVKKLIILAICSGDVKNKRNKHRILSLPLNQLLHSNRRIQRVRTNERNNVLKMLRSKIVYSSSRIS